MSKLYINPLYLDETNGNTLVNSPTNEIVLHSPSSNDELSVSEYTDAEESISAPTELFAEFLSAIMAKDYGNALRYCQLILQYEPNNTTAKDFYPHIMNKINEMTENSNAGESYNIPSSSSDDMDDEIMMCSSISDQSSDSSSYLNYSNCESDSSDIEEGRANLPIMDNLSLSQSSNSNSNNQPSNNNTSHSYSSILLEDEERELSLSDISNLNIDDDDNLDTSTKSNTISSISTSSRHEEPTNAVTVCSPVREPFAHKIMTIIRSKCISSMPKSLNH